MGLLDGKIALITGASRGIGKAIAVAFVDEDADVVLAGRDAAALGDTENEALWRGRRAVVVPTDMRDDAALTRLVEKAQDSFGQIDILVNCAGIGLAAGPKPPRTLADADSATLDALFATNVRGLVALTRAVVPLMEQRGGGTIINITGAPTLGDVGLHGATKAAVEHFSRTLAQTLADSHIRVSAVQIARPVNTAFYGGWVGADERARMLTAAAVADAVLALATDTTATGQIVRIGE